MKTKNSQKPRLRRLGGGGLTSAPILRILKSIDAKMDELVGYTRQRKIEGFKLSEGKCKQIDEALRRIDLGLCVSVTEAARYSISRPCKDGYTSVEALRGALRRRLKERLDARKRRASGGREYPVTR